MFQLYIIPGIVGVLSSLLMTRCWRAVSRDQRWQACIYEASSLAVTIIAWQLWAGSGNDWRVLASEGLGSVIGTWFAINPTLAQRVEHGSEKPGVSGANPLGGTI